VTSCGGEQIVAANPVDKKAAAESIGRRFV